MTERSCKIPYKYSKSPKPGNNASHDQTEHESPEISSDENDDNRVDDDSRHDDAEHISSPDLKNQKTPEQRSSPSARSTTSPPRKTPNLSSRKSPALWLIAPIVIALTASIAVYLYKQQTDKEHLKFKKSEYWEKIEKLKESIKEIKGTFPGQNRLTWSEIESGINEVMNGSQKPSIFVLYSNETREISCLAKMVGKASSKALHSGGILELTANDMGDDYGLAIDHWKSEINAKKAVVVYDVLKIKPQAIQAFHSMCDRETPLVKGAVYVLTIITSGNIPKFEKPVKFVENQLTNGFINKVPDDKLQPLITRLMDGPIIRVEPEIDFAGCPL